jgi:hypothetical protein
MIKNFFELCLIEINKININIDINRYKIKYSNQYYLNFIFYMLNDINNWHILLKIALCNFWRLGEFLLN